MRTEKYAKRVANKTNGLVDITLFFLIPINFKWPYHGIELTVAVVSLIIFNMHLVSLPGKP